MLEAMFPRQPWLGPASRGCCIIGRHNRANQTPLKRDRRGREFGTVTTTTTTPTATSRSSMIFILDVQRILRRCPTGRRAPRFHILLVPNQSALLGRASLLWLSSSPGHFAHASALLQEDCYQGRQRLRKVSQRFPFNVSRLQQSYAIRGIRRVCRWICLCHSFWPTQARLDSHLWTGVVHCKPDYPYYQMTCPHLQHFPLEKY